MNQPSTSLSNNKLHCRRRRRQDLALGAPSGFSSRIVFSAVLATILVSSSTVYSFVRPHHTHSRLHVLSQRASRQTIDNLTQPSNTTDSWSRQSTREGSRFGVRKRVRKVLEKAKRRTGIKNYSEVVEPRQVVAEAASIGGLDMAADLSFAADSNRATKTDYEPPRNGTGDLILMPMLSEAERIGKARELGVDVDALLTAENSPLPFSLPALSDDQRKRLAAGERLQEQSKMGREGSGYVVLDIKAPAYVVWECLLDFENYPEYIGTVRKMQMFTNTHLASSYYAEDKIAPETTRDLRHYGTASISRASFVLSKFKLNIAAIHKYQPHPDGHYMIFTLDRANKGAVLKDAKGIWYAQKNPDGLGQDVTRVWLLCSLKVSSLLPTFIVDYAAQRAMPRATTWLAPVVEKKFEEMKEQ